MDDIPSPAADIAVVSAMSASKVSDVPAASNPPAPTSVFSPKLNDAVLPVENFPVVSSLTAFPTFDDIGNGGLQDPEQVSPAKSVVAGFTPTSDAVRPVTLDAAPPTLSTPLSAAAANPPTRLGEKISFQASLSSADSPGAEYRPCWATSTLVD